MKWKNHNMAHTTNKATFGRLGFTRTDSKAAATAQASFAEDSEM